uniref:Uncharacterized protein LOC114331907 n=1 Tax=Diabrotica virgifera virgifera TaxID=50390 RepID=A0A6P7FRI3_DIAVI
MLNKISSIGSYYYYHFQCKQVYVYQFNGPTNERTVWHDVRDLHKKAFEKICDYVEINVIENKNSYSLKVLTDKYLTILSNLAKENQVDFDSNFFQHHLLDKFINRFGNQIQIITIFKKKLIASRMSCNINESTFGEITDLEEQTRVGTRVRKSILSINKKRLPRKLETSHLIAGECDIDDIPENLISLLRCIITNNDSRRLKSENCMRKIYSIACDIIYAASDGKIKTSKHITLGMTLKSITSSRKVVDICNRYGHCCSYHTIEELETEATFYANDKSVICPLNTVLLPDYCTGIAFDNYDRYVETLNGKDTLHDTVGILYQNIEEGHEMNSAANKGNLSPLCKRRRTFDAIAPEIQNYNKALIFKDTLLPLESPLRNITSSNANYMKKIDFLWLLSHFLEIPNTPLWVGFNSKIISDDSTQQRVSYLTPINLSPTNQSVVYLTLRQAQQIASECKQNYMQVSYDLAIAKMALQIQNIEKPLFDNVFIRLGDFHIMMAYFHAIGKFIDECGLTTLMVEAELLASGSVNGFISGKHFNRCKRLYPILYLTFHMLHFDQFLTDNEITIDDSIRELLDTIFIEKVSPLTFENEDLSKLIKKYIAYKEKTVAGDHGYTAQFYIILMNLIQNYLIFSRSIRTGDFDTYKYIIPKLNDIFFLFNHQNYSRWLCKYHDNLLNLDKTHPKLAVEFDKGMFGIKRTKNIFSRIPVDLTLEQTVNADAARRLTGVTHFTNSISARQRWAKSSCIHTTIVSHVLDCTGLKQCQDVTSDLEKSKIIISNKQVKASIRTINENMNPFKHTEIDHKSLFNIATGKATTCDVRDFLLNIELNGKNLRETFIKECATSESRFEQPIAKNKILNFASAHVKKKIVVNNKVHEVRLQRDLFGRLLCISLTNNTDVEKALTYPITPVPMSMCQMDGTICKTKKSLLVECLHISNGTIPSCSEIDVIDGFYILHCLVDIPQTFGNIAKKVLKKITNNTASEIHLIFDQYFEPSITNYERSSRGNNEAKRSFNITGPNQKRPVDFLKELRNNKFK